MKKRALTLLEIMMVIFIITLITGTIGYNMRGALDKGRAFRTEQAKDQLHDLLLIALAESGDIETIAKQPLTALESLGLAKDPRGLLVDGWKQPFKITPKEREKDFDIRSDAYIKYKNRQRGNAAVSESKEEE